MSSSSSNTKLDWRANANVRISRQLNFREREFLDLFSNTQYFNLKVMLKMILDNRLMLANLSDKAESVEIMREFIADSFLPKRHAIVDEAEGLRDVDLPSEFFLKVNHGSGGVIGVSKRASVNATLPEFIGDAPWSRYLIHPQQFSIDNALPHIDSWLSTTYRQEPESIREWCYSQIQPKLIVEELLTDINVIPRQLNIYCFHGKALAFYHSDRRPDMKGLIHLTFLPEEANQARIYCKITKQDWNEIVRASEAIASCTDMLRVDWLLTDKGPIFSELTNYPHGGFLKFDSTSTRSKEDVDEIFSEYWGEIGPY